MIKAYREGRVTLGGYFLWAATRWAMCVVFAVVLMHIAAMVAS